MATHSSVPAWRIPGMGEPGGLPSMGLHRVGHNWSDLAAAAAVKTPAWNHFFLIQPLRSPVYVRASPPQHGYLFPFVSEGLSLCASMCFIQNICLIFPLSQSSFSFSIPSFSFSSSFFSASLHLSFFLKKICIGCLDTQDLHCILWGRSMLRHRDSLVVARV